MHIFYIVTGLLLLSLGLWELTLYFSYGKIVEEEYAILGWLKGDIKLDPLDDRNMYKLPDPNDNIHIVYIGDHGPALFTKYHVKTMDGKKFRILRNTPIHQAIQEEHEKLIERQDMNLTNYEKENSE